MYYIVKSYASQAQIDEGKAYAEAAGYTVNLEGSSPNFSIDVAEKTVHMNGPTGTRLFSLAAFKRVIDDNPVVVATEDVPPSESPVEEAPTEESYPVAVVEEPVEVAYIGNAVKTVIRAKDLFIATSVEEVEIAREGEDLAVAIG